MSALTLARFMCAALLLWVCGAAMAIEEPKYSVLETFEDFEVRSYSPYVVAETAVQADFDQAGNDAFGILAGYIFGKNKGARKIEMTAPVTQAPTTIAMTAPVTQTAAAGEVMVQFAMPREWTLETLPEPLDPRVKLREVPARKFAVIRYSGFWSERRYREHLEKLEAALEREGLHWRGEPVWARYNPPWTPWFLRRNEIWLEVDGD
jgi:hypothetical protein